MKTSLCFLLNFILLQTFIFSFAARSQAGSAEKLLLAGGGDIPQAALSRYCEAAGGRSARILVITWATAHPDDTFKGFSDELAFCHPAAIEQAPQGPFLTPQKRDFAARLKTYSAVFFTGGDQNRILDVLESGGDPDLTGELRTLYHTGVPFGGTSAGTAIMSPITLTGAGDETVLDGGAIETRAGLGLLDGVILDTHFIRRQRENRLFGLILVHSSLQGVGIDQDTALWITGGRYGELSGRAQVMLVNATPGGGLRLGLLHAGDHVDLSSR